jgi:ABC-type cobalamin transport system permease subunit
LRHDDAVGLRDRFTVTSNPVVAAVLVAALWIGVSAILGGVGFVDLVVAAVLIVGGLARQRSRKSKLEKDDGSHGIYGPPR